jgi:D-tyrosyl-tRNA(Tyr) deacylase
MRALLQRVSWAKVEVAGRVTGSIGHGLLILLGITHDDTEAESERLANKIAKLRIFADGEGKMNLSVLDIGGSALVVSQFTLYADTRRGNRPGYSQAAEPKHAKALYQDFMARLRRLGVPVATGEFGAYMQVSLVNDGPVTIWLDTAELSAG